MEPNNVAPEKARSLVEPSPVEPTNVAAPVIASRVKMLSLPPPVAKIVKLPPPSSRTPRPS